MPREKPGFRSNMEGLNELFPMKEVLSIADVHRYTGWTPRTAKKRLSQLREKGFITKRDLATYLS